MAIDPEDFVLSCLQAQDYAEREIVRLRRTLDAGRSAMDELAASLFRDAEDRERLLAAVEAAGRAGVPPRRLVEDLRDAPERLGVLRLPIDDSAAVARHLAVACEARAALQAMLGRHEALLEQAIAAESVPFRDRDRAAAELDRAIERVSQGLEAWLRQASPSQRQAHEGPPAAVRAPGPALGGGSE